MTLFFACAGNKVYLDGTNVRDDMSNAINGTGSGILTSPFFPARYPRDLGMEYIVTCPNEEPACRIRILFSDFQLAAVSIMEVLDCMIESFSLFFPLLLKFVIL